MPLFKPVFPFLHYAKDLQNLICKPTKFGAIFFKCSCLKCVSSSYNLLMTLKENITLLLLKKYS